MGILSAASESTLEQVSQFNKVLHHYKRQEWQAALAALTSLKERAPAIVYYQIYIERLHAKQGNDFDTKWDGTYTHNRK